MDEKAEGRTLEETCQAWQLVRGELEAERERTAGRPPSPRQRDLEVEDARLYARLDDRLEAIIRGELARFRDHPDRSELHSVAAKEAWEAARKFDPDHEHANLAGYVRVRVRNRLRDEAGRAAGITPHERRTVLEGRRDLALDLGREPTVAEIAAKVGYRQEVVQRCLRLGSADLRTGPRPDGGPDVVLADPDGVSQEDLLEAKERRDALLSSRFIHDGPSWEDETGG